MEHQLERRKGEDVSIFIYEKEKQKRRKRRRKVLTVHPPRAPLGAASLVLFSSHFGDIGCHAWLSMSLSSSVRHSERPPHHGLKLRFYSPFSSPNGTKPFLVLEGTATNHGCTCDTAQLSWGQDPVCSVAAPACARLCKAAAKHGLLLLVVD